MQNLDLIDWKLVGFSALWIMGLAVILSTFGFADYHAAMEKDRFRQVIHKPGYRASIDVGLILFCLGLTGSARSWLEAALWLLFAVIFSFYMVRALRERAQDLPPVREEHSPEEICHGNHVDEDQHESANGEP